jgi:hypothetical protein
MEFSAEIVKWAPVVSLQKKKNLEAAWSQAMYEDRKPAWSLECCSWFIHLDDVNNNAAELYERGLRPRLPDEVREKADEFFSQFIATPDKWDFPNDLGGKYNEVSWVATISPKSVKHYLKVLAEIDFKAWKPIWEEIGMPSWKKDLAKHQYGDPKKSFEEGFLRYIKLWEKLLSKAAKKNAGILIRIV